MTKQHPTLTEAVEQYLSLRRARYANTSVRQEGYVLRRFAAWIERETGRDVQVRHLRPEHVEDFFYGPHGVMAEHWTRDGRRREPLQASSHNYLRTRLKGLFDYLAHRGLTRAALLTQVTPMRVDVKLRLQPG